ncbi:putative uncharacterized protein C1orf229 homolog [Trachypithecus francoisi]|uniref:putative uncharacterized protein C1orf229 homolog n=1 Tax=Trachypithecus francoisi TaxID=54180 RepID=UPI00141B4073|nr:putative uncharacterized protein C1orf229 homolog [Trachypithecus francoisi]XP_033087920.1 putative uncharacterized protein C1orf229 homolog [Trachypithecus francoisi]
MRTLKPPAWEATAQEPAEPQLTLNRSKAPGHFDPGSPRSQRPHPAKKSEAAKALDAKRLETHAGLRFALDVRLGSTDTLCFHAGRKCFAFSDQVKEPGRPPHPPHQTEPGRDRRAGRGSWAGLRSPARGGPVAPTCAPGTRRDAAAVGRGRHIDPPPRPISPSAATSQSPGTQGPGLRSKAQQQRLHFSLQEILVKSTADVLMMQSMTGGMSDGEREGEAKRRI